MSGPTDKKGHRSLTTSTPAFWVENRYALPPLRRQPFMINIPGFFGVYL